MRIYSSTFFIVSCNSFTFCTNTTFCIRILVLHIPPSIAPNAPPSLISPTLLPIAPPINAHKCVTSFVTTSLIISTNFCSIRCLMDNSFIYILYRYNLSFCMCRTSYVQTLLPILLLLFLTFFNLLVCYIIYNLTYNETNVKSFLCSSVKYFASTKTRCFCFVSF